jgi:hypothetical protein
VVQAFRKAIEPFRRPARRDDGGSAYEERPDSALTHPAGPPDEQDSLTGEAPGGGCGSFRVCHEFNGLM